MKKESFSYYTHRETNISYSWKWTIIWNDSFVDDDDDDKLANKYRHIRALFSWCIMPYIYIIH